MYDKMRSEVRDVKAELEAKEVNKPEPVKYQSIFTMSGAFG